MGWRDGCSQIDYSHDDDGDFTACKYDGEPTAALTVVGVRIKPFKRRASLPVWSQLCDWWSSCCHRVSAPAILLFPDCLSHCVLLAAGEQLALWNLNGEERATGPPSTTCCRRAAECRSEIRASRRWIRLGHRWRDPNGCGALN